MSDGIEEGWTLGCDNVPPSVKAERERRFAEKRRQTELAKMVAAGKTDPSPQPPPARGDLFKAYQPMTAGYLPEKVVKQSGKSSALRICFSLPLWRSPNAQPKPSGC